MALCEDESRGLARVASSDRIVRTLTAWGKRGKLSAPADEARQSTWRDRQIEVDYLDLARKGGRA